MFHDSWQISVLHGGEWGGGDFQCLHDSPSRKHTHLEYAKRRHLKYSTLGDTGLLEIIVHTFNIKVIP